MNTPRTCGELTSDGSPCKSVGPLYRDGACGWHSADPAAEEWRTKMRELAQQQGLANRKPRESFNPDEVPSPPKTLDDLREWAAWVTWATATGQMDKDVASKITAALGELRRIIKEGEHAERIAEIERKIKAAQERKA
jgi:hypothetical protein